MEIVAVATDALSDGGAIAHAAKATFDENPDAFINELKIPAFIVPLVNADNNQHSPNENLKIAQIGYGIRTFYKLLST